MNLDTTHNDNPTTVAEVAGSKEGNEGSEDASEEKVSRGLASSAEQSEAEEEDTKKPHNAEKGKATEEGQQKDEEGGTYYKEGTEDGTFRIPLRLTKSGRKKSVPFPVRLMKVLSQQEHADVIAWTPSGKAFAVLQPKAFVAKILPEEFKSAKYSSFTRKLHRWGFMRHYRGQDAGAFYHKHFQKGRLDLVEKMSCYKPVSSDAKGSSASSPAGLPDSVPQDASLTGASAAAVRSGSLSSLPDEAAEASSTQANAAAASFNVTMAMQQQQLQQQQFQQQQQLQQMQMQLQQQQQGAAGQMPLALDGNSDLNTAIELEVSRRLKERINAAALSRQVMMIPQQQQQPQPGNMQGSGGGFDANTTRTVIFPTQANAPMGTNAGIPTFAATSMQGFPFSQQQPQPQGAVFTGMGLQGGGIGGFNQPLMNAGGGFKPFEATSVTSMNQQPHHPQAFSGGMFAMQQQQMPQMAKGVVMQPSNDGSGNVETDPESAEDDPKLG